MVPARIGFVRPLSLDNAPMRTKILMASAALCLATSCGRAPEPLDARILSVYVRSWYGTIRVERLSPPVASRIAAYAATALYAGMAAVRKDLPALEGVLNGIPALPHAGRPTDYDETITAVEAERVALDSLLAEALPTTRTALARLADSLVAARMAGGVSDAVRDSSSALGRRIGLRSSSGRTRTDSTARVAGRIEHRSAPACGSTTRRGTPTPRRVSLERVSSSRWTIRRTC